MKLLIVGTYPGDQQYSLTGYARALHDGLPAHGIETRLITPTIRAGKLRPSHSKISKWLGHFDKIVLFPYQLRRAIKWADAVHLVDYGLAPYVRYLQNVPHLVTCHDLIAMRAARGELPEWKTAGTASVFQKMILAGLNDAQHIACISEATRSDLLHLTTVSKERTTVIYNGFFQSYEKMSHEESLQHLERIAVSTEQPFLLHIGRDAPTKNRIGVLKIFEALHRSGDFDNLHLVLAGKPLSPELKAWIIQRHLQKFVYERFHLSEGELRALYSCAKALVFPSFYEGFGMPIIEAQACGCPVFTSNRAPMTEVGGAAAVYFDPSQPENAAQLIKENLQSPQKIQSMVDSGYDNIKRFTVDRMVREYASVYRDKLYPI